LANDIEPWAALSHFDLPLALQFEKDGWLNSEIQDCFADFARVCFENFGDRVKHWITFNEAWVVATLSHGKGMFAPGRSSDKETCLAAHNMLLAHAKAYRLYDKEFRPSQKGFLGITNNGDWREPLTDSPEDRAAAQKALEYYFGWFTDPVFFGRYPDSMRQGLKEILPEFTPAEQKLIKGTTDFVGLNHYTTFLAADAYGNTEKPFEYANHAFPFQQAVNLSVDPDWEITEMGWPIVPEGLYKLLKWIDDRYSRPIIYITENGGAFHDELEAGKVDDQSRLDYLEGYISASHKALQEGVNIKGYFVWSFMDNFEWALGYGKRFGLHYVDFKTLERIPKKSAGWFKDVIRDNGIK